MEKHLHIVSFDVPYPADYGGVIPVFALLDNLKEEGISVHLHCFDYGRGHQAELNKYCRKVNYYDRKLGLKGFSFSLPYIVSSRNNKELRRNLLQDEYPILLEGVHCSRFALDPDFNKRKIAVRLHNVEFNYYRHLARNSASLFKRMYYFFESRLLKNYESRLAKAAKLISLSAEDKSIYQRKLGARDIIYIPMPVTYSEVKSQPGLGSFCLYHGNLAISENEKAAIWLCKKVFNDLPISLVVAGKNPSEELKQTMNNCQNVKLIANPTDTELQQLIGAAQINVLPSFNSTGIKLKLLNALFNGRHCLVNPATACSTQIVSLCHIADDEAEFKSLIRSLFTEAFSDDEIQAREEVLLRIYDNATNTRSLVEWIC